jgi:hypothetical protein
MDRVQQSFFLKSGTDPSGPMELFSLWSATQCMFVEWPCTDVRLSSRTCAVFPLEHDTCLFWAWLPWKLPYRLLYSFPVVIHCPINPSVPFWDMEQDLWIQLPLLTDWCQTVWGDVSYQKICLQCAVTSHRKNLDLNHIVRISCYCMVYWCNNCIEYVRFFNVDLRTSEHSLCGIFIHGESSLRLSAICSFICVKWRKECATG